MRIRIAYGLLAICVMIVGLTSRRYRVSLPPFVGEYSGDALWALMLYLVVSVVSASQSITHRALISIALAILVETSQLYHAAWIDDIRSTRLGGLILGFGFLWSDLVCYCVGIVCGAVIEVAAHRLRVRLRAMKER